MTLQDSSNWPSLGEATEADKEVLPHEGIVVPGRNYHAEQSQSVGAQIDRLLLRISELADKADRIQEDARKLAEEIHASLESTEGFASQVDSV